MNYPQCSHENRPQAKFCSECGAKLEQVCPACGVVVSPSARFCDDCGSMLNPVPAGGQTSGGPVAKTSELPSLAEGERRHLTVMFCDLADFTPLSESLDPEDLQHVLHEYHSMCSAVIQRFEGSVAKFLGDGVLAYFGYPQAHEDDAQRAVRAGLSIVEAAVDLKIKLRNQREFGLALRVGVHTGLVVLGEIGGERIPEAIGDTVNVAARVQAIAEHGALVVTAATHQLIEGLFDCRDMGDHELKGISQPVRLYRVLHESTARSRLEVAEKRGLTPLVGREQEMGLLLDRWEQISEGVGQVILLSGEAGIGKSRLLQALKEHVSGNPKAWLTSCRCSPYHQNSAFYPIINLLEEVVLKFTRTDSAESRLAKLEGFLLQYGLLLPDTVPLFSSLVSIPLSDDYVPLSLTPEAQKQKILLNLLTILLRRASKQPLLFIVEDLHWIDASTLELLNLIVDQGPSTRLLAIFTCRPEFNHPWTGRSHLTHVTLNRLNRRQVSDMVGRVTRSKALPAEVIHQIVDKTDGVPLFVEELTKMVLESGLLREKADGYELTAPLPQLAIPTTLHDSLMARLDRLATVKEVAQIGATVGREFSYEVLKTILPMEEAKLQNALAQLVGAELIYQRGIPPEATFTFKHALIQEAAYQSLLISRRQQYHHKIGQVLETRYPETADTQPELLAYHFSNASNHEQAIPYWLKAGERAVERSAHVEAIQHLATGLDSLKMLPKTIERDQLEIKLQICLGASLTATRGYGVKEVENAYTRAQELSRRTGDTAQLFRAMYGLCRLHMLRAEYKTAHEESEEIIHLTAAAGNPSFVVAANRAIGAILFYLGELSNSKTHVEQVIALTSDRTDPSNTLIQDIYDVVDPRVTCHSYAAWDLWLLGYPEQARGESERALALADEIDHPFSKALALSFATWLSQFLRDVERTHSLAQAALGLSNEQGFPFWIGWGRVLRGWVLAENGEGEAAIQEIMDGIAFWRAKGSELGRAYFLVLLAEAYRKNGQVMESLDALAEAKEFAENTGERFWEAERLRLKGELLLENGAFSVKEVEECFCEAIEVARRQKAKSLELRAAVSLGRLWRNQGRRQEAREILSPIYKWFTEGFDTEDLRQAKTLLADLV